MKKKMEVLEQEKEKARLEKEALENKVRELMQMQTQQQQTTTPPGTANPTSTDSDAKVSPPLQDAVSSEPEVSVEGDAAAIT